MRFKEGPMEVVKRRFPRRPVNKLDLNIYNHFFSDSETWLKDIFLLSIIFSNYPNVKKEKLIKWRADLTMSEHMDEMTYSKAGVDIDLESLAIKALVKEISGTMQNRKGKIGESISGIGHFAGLVKLDDKRALAMGADGVGTKILVAELINKYDTIGFDLVAMNANDVICTGAEPLFMLDYIAIDKPDPKVLEEVGKGLAKACGRAGISIPGGEMATLPEMVHGLDLAGVLIGIVDIDNVITGEKISIDDVVVGLESSGIHSNGLTLARKVILSHYGPNDEIFEGKTAGEVLLEPTKIYVPEVLDIIKNVEVKGLANITGGGLGNLTRITKYGFYIDNMPKPMKVFQKIQELGNVSDKEMYRTFNMGVGFCVIVAEKDAGKVIEISKKHGTGASIIGKVVEEEGVRIKGKVFVMKY